MTNRPVHALLLALALGLAPLQAGVADTPEPTAKPAWISQHSSENSETGKTLMGMLQGLGACLGVFFLGIALYQRSRRDTPGSNARRLVLKERVSITAKTSLILVECDGKSFLCSVGQEPVTIMGETLQATSRSRGPELVYPVEGVCVDESQKRSA